MQAARDRRDARPPRQAAAAARVGPSEDLALFLGGGGGGGGVGLAASAVGGEEGVRVGAAPDAPPPVDARLAGEPVGVVPPLRPSRGEIELDQRGSLGTG